MRKFNPKFAIVLSLVVGLVSVTTISAMSEVKIPALRDGACRKTDLTTEFALLQKKTQQSIEPSSWLCHMYKKLTLI